MTQSTATRRLVKSPPELWAELGSEESLRRHLAEFGEIKITRVTPKSTVAWEGDRASGTVELVATGWGTKVVLTATPAPASPQAKPAAPAADRAPVTDPPRIVIRREPERAPRRGLLGRLFRRAAPAGSIPGPPPPTPDPVPPAPMPDPSPVPPPAPDPVPPTPTPQPPSPPQIEVLDPGRTAAILTGVLDGLGAAHHRPFSRD